MITSVEISEKVIANANHELRNWVERGYLRPAADYRLSSANIITGAQLEIVFKPEEADIDEQERIITLWITDNIPTSTNIAAGIQRWTQGNLPRLSLKITATQEACQELVNTLELDLSPGLK